VSESLQAYLRRETRNFTSPLDEDAVFDLATALAGALAEAHATDPPRFPGCDPERIERTDAGLRLDGRSASAREDLLQLRALVSSLLLGRPPHLSWRLDGPPDYAARSLFRRAALRAFADAPSGRELHQALEGSSRPAVSAAPPWPTFRGDGPRGGARPEAGTPAGLAPRWRAATGPVIASPVCADSWVAAVTTAGRLLLFDAESGRLLDAASLGAGSESSPALSGSLLLVGTEDGALLAFDVEAGTVRWRVNLGRLVRSSPLASDGRVFVGVIEDRGGALAALDAHTGERLWRRSLGPVFASPTLLEGAVAVGSDDGSLRAFDLDGAPLWSAELGGKVRSTAAFAPGALIVADYAGRVCALDAGEGRLLWCQPVGSPVYASPSVRGDRCLVGTHAGTVHALDTANGSELFRLTAGGPIVGSAVAVGDAWLVPSTDGALHLVDRDGASVVAHSTGAPIQSSPALGPGRVYVADDRSLSAFELLS
jgi:outer membrane protein assembly factor BamB